MKGGLILQFCRLHGDVLKLTTEETRARVGFSHTTQPQPNYTPTQQREGMDGMGDAKGDNGQRGKEEGTGERGDGHQGEGGEGSGDRAGERRGQGGEREWRWGEGRDVTKEREGRDKRDVTDRLDGRDATEKGHDGKGMTERGQKREDGKGEGRRWKGRWEETGGEREKGEEERRGRGEESGVEEREEEREEKIKRR